MARKALGRGLNALLANVPTAAGELPLVLPVHRLRPNPRQPRKDLNEEGLESLAASIREHGILQPLLVRATEEGNGIFEIIAGERRWRAAQRASLEEVPVRVVELNESQVLEAALVENIQREDLNVLEVAEALAELIDNYALTQEEAARKVGWSRAAVTNKLRLLTLPEELRQNLREGRLNEGHCRPLLTLEERDMVAIGRKTIEEGLSVRAVENLARKAGRGEAPQKKSEKLSTRETELEGTSIRVSVSGRGEQRTIRLTGVEERRVETIFRILREGAEKYFPGNNGSDV